MLLPILKHTHTHIIHFNFFNGARTHRHLQPLSVVVLESGSSSSASGKLTQRGELKYADIVRKKQ